METMEEQIEPVEENQPDWKDAVIYGVVSLAMLAVLAYSAADNLNRSRVAARPVDLSQQQVSRVLNTLKPWGTNAEGTFFYNAIRALDRAEGTLFDRKPSPSPEELEVLRDIREAKAQIESARAVMRTLLPLIDPLPDAGPQGISFGLITDAYAQGTRRGNSPNTEYLPVQVKTGFAIVAFITLIGMIVYCLWMIARPVPSKLTRAQRKQFSDDKKWAKELLNKSLVFVGGLIFGVTTRPS